MEFLILFFATLVTFVVLLAYSSFSWGLVMFKFYYWFLIGVFVDLPLITFSQAVGLALFASLLKNHSQTSVKKEYRDDSNSTLTLIIAPWITLLFGWIVYGFIR